MLTWILLVLAAIVLIPILAFAALYVFQGPIGRWIFKNEMIVPPED